MNKVNEKLGTNYGLFNYYGAPDADGVIVAMGLSTMLQKKLLIT